MTRCFKSPSALFINNRISKQRKDAISKKIKPQKSTKALNVNKMINKFENTPLTKRRCLCRWRTTKFSPIYRRLWPFSREGSLSCHTCYGTRPRFNGLIRRTTPFIRRCRKARITFINPASPGLELINQNQMFIHVLVGWLFGVLLCIGCILGIQWRWFFSLKVIRFEVSLAACMCLLLRSKGLLWLVRYSIELLI